MIDIESAQVEELKDPVKSAEIVGLKYVTDVSPGITRERSGADFRYRSSTGKIIEDEKVLGRIKSIAIPPAWTEVWICPDPN